VLDLLIEVQQAILRRKLTYLLAIISLGAGVAAYLCIGALAEFALGLALPDSSHDPLSMSPSFTVDISTGLPLHPQEEPAVDTDRGALHRELSTDQLAALVRQTTGRDVAVSEMYLADVKYKRWALLDTPILALSGNTFTGGFRSRDGLARGRLLGQEDDEQRRGVCLISWQTQEILSRGGDPLGQTIRLAGRPFVIVGVLRSGYHSVFGPSAVIPLSSARLAFPGDQAQQAHVSAFSTGERLPREMDQIEARLNQITKSRFRWRDQFNPRPDSAQVNETAPPKFGLFSGWLAAQYLRRDQQRVRVKILGLAVLALSAGLLGLVSMLLANLNNRIHEIGVRRALGATRGRQAAATLCEAAVTGLLGGAAGVPLGIGVLRVLSAGFGVSLNAPPLWLLAAIIASTTSAVLAGLIPARAAMRISPADALREL